MPAQYPAGLTSIYGETLPISRSLKSVGLPGFETKQALIYCPTHSFRMHINPAVTGVVYYDATNSAGARFERGSGTTDSLTRDVTDRSVTGTGTAMDSAATGDRLYICLADRIGGLHLDVRSKNANASTMTVNYWNGAWTSVNVRDGTISGSTSLARDGNLTWDVPTDWLQAHLGGSASDAMSITDIDAPGLYGYWLQIYFSAALSADVEIANIWTLNKNDKRGYFLADREYDISFDRRNTGAIEAILEDEDEDAELQITWLRTTKE